MLFLTLMAFSAWASDYSDSNVPLYEFGALLGSAILPDYPAASQSRNRSIPLPLFHFSGDLLRADDQDGTRLRFISLESLDLNLSFGGSFPTETGNNQARSGMPNLDWTAEIGPRLVYYFYRKPQIGKISLGLPIRSNFATNFVRFYGIGYVVAPGLKFEKYNLFDDVDLYFDLTSNFISQGVAQYFYGIDPAFETPERIAYTAKEGFLGHEISLAFKFRFGNKNLIVGTQYADYSQSANKQSFLHQSNVNWSFVAALSWVFFQSSERGTN